MGGGGWDGDGGGVGFCVCVVCGACMNVCSWSECRPCYIAGRQWMARVRGWWVGARLVLVGWLGEHGGRVVLVGWLAALACRYSFQSQQ